MTSRIRIGAVLAVVLLVGGVGLAWASARSHHKPAEETVQAVGDDSTETSAASTIESTDEPADTSSTDDTVATSTSSTDGAGRVTTTPVPPLGVEPGAAPVQGNAPPPTTTVTPTAAPATTAAPTTTAPPKHCDASDLLVIYRPQSYDPVPSGSATWVGVNVDRRGSLPCFLTSDDTQEFTVRDANGQLVYRITGNLYDPQFSPRLFQPGQNVFFWGYIYWHTDCAQPIDESAWNECRPAPAGTYTISVTYAGATGQMVGVGNVPLEPKITLF